MKPVLALLVVVLCSQAREVDVKTTDYSVSVEAKTGVLRVRDGVDTSSCSQRLKTNEWNQFVANVSGAEVELLVNGEKCTSAIVPSLTTKINVPDQARKLKITKKGNSVWKPLWDGKTLDGWAPRGGANWTIEDGAIHGQSKTDDPRIGMLVGNVPLTDFVIRTRFRIPKGNSGLFLRTNPESLACYEVEIDSEKRTGGFWEVGGRNWVTGPEDNKVVRPDEWNELIAVLKGHRILFMVNGVTTIDLPDDVKGRTEGVVGLQAHGSRRPTDVWFKDIAILIPAK